MRVVLLHDEVRAHAPADERDVLTQMDAVAGALAQLGHESVRVPCTIDLAAVSKRLTSIKPELVFNLVESINGQGRLIHLAPSLLDYLGLPHTGCPTSAIFATSGKLLAKQLLCGAYLATPTWYSAADLSRSESFEQGVYILKSVWEHASRGIDEGSTVDATEPRTLLRSLEARRTSLAGEGFAELYISGREFNISLLAGEVLPHAEIQFAGFADSPKIGGYRAKWDESSREYKSTPPRFDFPRSDDDLLRQLTSISQECWRLFGLRGYARVDFRVDETGFPWVLEVNANPCLSPDAGFAAAVENAGMTYPEAIRRIIDDTLCPKR
jgi:D-alanine-D-alanine ligase